MTPGLVEKPRYRVLAQTLFPSLAPSSAERSEAGAWPQVVTLSFENPHRELVATLHRLVDSSGIPTVFVKIVRDETRTREVFARQSELVGVAAHQLRTPLTALRWSLESARAKAEEAPGLIKEALALTDRCLKIVNDFLDAAKIEEGKFGLAVERVDLVMLIKPLVDLIAPAAKERRVSVSFSHSGLASLAASVDPSRLSTALLNFLDNAIRYNVSGGSVSIALERRGEAAAVTIADTGIGIPKGEERKLFKKLERGSNAIQVEPNGSGLGLYIARNIIASHGGSVTVASELNRGTSFTITIPLNTP